MEYKTIKKYFLGPENKSRVVRDRFSDHKKLGRDDLPQEES